MLLHTYKNLENIGMKYSKIDAEIQIKVKSLVAWLISKRRVDQKQTFNFLRPNSWLY